jgi:tetratricopeptide (TPR) repeat protein
MHRVVPYLISRIGILFGLAMLVFGALTNQSNIAWSGAALILIGAVLETFRPSVDARIEEAPQAMPKETTSFMTVSRITAASMMALLVIGGVSYGSFIHYSRLTELDNSLEVRQIVLSNQIEGLNAQKGQLEEGLGKIKGEIRDLQAQYKQLQHNITEMVLANDAGIGALAPALGMTGGIGDLGWSDIDQAEAYSTKWKELAEDYQYMLGEASAEVNLGIIAQLRKDADGAIRHFEAALKRSEEENSKPIFDTTT